MDIKLIFCLIVCVTVANVASAQDCPSGWKTFNNKCWYFSGLQNPLSWSGAESWCQLNGGHLVSFVDVAERDWAVDQNMKLSTQSRWWIGLTDSQSEGNFKWSDGSPYDPAVANWKPLEPNNAYLENCVEIWIDNLPPVINDKQWNDNACDVSQGFACKREPGVFETCPDGYQENNGRCYGAYTSSLSWIEAQQQCKNHGGNLVSIGSDTERQFVQNLVSPWNTNTWIGYSDTSTPGTLSWTDVNTNNGYSYWASTPPSTLPYYGSTCIEMNQGLSYRWNWVKCSEERQFVCERGPRGKCPPTWLYNSVSQKCYEFVVNPNRVHTWSSAKQICQGLGGGLLKVQSSQEELFVGTILESYTESGHPLVWIGASDVGHDDAITWWDQTSVENYYWGPGMPQFVPGREDCVALYTGKSGDNWETATCFEERAYICELPEGQDLPNVPVITVDGKCEQGWRHLGDKCYFFGAEEKNNADAKTYCAQNQAMLTSILNANELSFIVGNLQVESWIGLTGSNPNYQWSDNEAFNPNFINWIPGEPTGDGTCYTVNHNGEWADRACDLTRPSFICKKDDIPVDHVTIAPPTYVPDLEKCGGDGWISDPTSNRCYKINLDRRSWQDARFACQQGGGELASMNSPEENAHVAALVQNIPTESYFWLGGNDLNNYNIELVDQGWSWSDESAFNYINWAPSEPNNVNVEDCMEMYASHGQWNDADCFVFHGSVCEKVGDMTSIVGPDITDDSCDSNAACCFKHIGAEFGGTLPDSALSASSEADEWFTADRGRLNTVADVVILPGDQGISVGNGHGGWRPNGGDTNPWLQVDLPYHTELKGIITQGRNGIVIYLDRSWVTSYKISYSQDKVADKWEFITDANGDQVIFNGNADQNTQVTNLFPRPIIARHVRCHPVTWFDSPTMRLEYVGCQASCLRNLGMNSGNIPDTSISAVSSKNGREPKQARAPVNTDECLPTASNAGEAYRGWISRTKSGLVCQEWSSQTPHRHNYQPESYPQAGLRSNHCRNPNGDRSTPWCYTMDPNVEWEECSIPVCPSYTPAGWSPVSASKDQWIQVSFDGFYKLSGVTMYGGRTSFVTAYTIRFSDDAINFKTYNDQNGDIHIFRGLSAGEASYLDILREPITTKHVRLYPDQWSGEPAMQFELNGCYADDRITCSDTGDLWQDEEGAYTVECPSGCVEDPEAQPVYGTETYTRHSSVCRAAVHAGRVLNSHGGPVTVEPKEGLVSYGGSYAHGITSQDFGPYGASFHFTGKTLRCDDGWLPWKDHCYYISNKGVALNWHDARGDCISRGGDLASILTQGENDFINAQLLVADVGGDIWIGLNDLEIVNYYKWSDGSPVTMTKWFWDEPKQTNKQCVNIYRFEGYWNDKRCDDVYPYLCKKEKELLPPLEGPPPGDEGCDAGWTAFGSSCYWASNDEFMFIYANRICEESDAKLAAVHDDYEQSFIHALVLNTLPPGLGYTSWIGLSAKITETGSLYYGWETGEPVTYTHWDRQEPDVRFSCAFPFVYQGITFYECTTYNHPARMENTPWCSIDPQYRGGWINCGTTNEYGCTHMDDQTGYWQIDVCGQNRYYVCEKDRVGYTQPVETTPSTDGGCAVGWMGSSNTVACYQINEFAEAANRATWFDAVDHCRAQGAEIVSLHSPQEELEIANFIAATNIYSYVGFWTGLNNIDLNEGYQWTDGTPVSYTNWGDGEPNDHNGKEPCVETLFINYATWNDLNSDALRNWVCKISKRDTPLPPPTLPPPGGEVSTACGTDGTWILFTPSYGLEKCYMFVDETTQPWSLAEQDCTARGGNLVAIHSQDENSFVLSRAAKMNVGSSWIGLRTVNSANGPVFGWSDNSLVDYTNWAKGEPNNYFDQEDCAEFDVFAGLWNDDNCAVPNGYVCEKYLGADTVPITPTAPVEGGCPAGFVAFGNKCWMFGGYGDDPTLDWFTSLERCANNSADVATIVNEYEQAFVTSMLPTVGRTAWIGLNGRIGGHYVWHDQTPVTYTNWMLGEPDGGGDSACVYVVSGSSDAGKWADADCNGNRAYVCSVLRSPTLPEPTTPSAEMCSPGFQFWSGNCYKVVDGALSRSEAMATCMDSGANTNLVSITNAYENGLLMSWFLRDINAAESIWTGLTYVQMLTENEDTITTFTWDDGWPVEYTNWGPFEPNAEIMAGGSGCVQMASDGTWKVTSSAMCDSTLPYICKQLLLDIPTTPDPGEGTCDPHFFAYGQNCYYVETAQTTSAYRSWHDASYECQIRGATLASFHSEEECLAVIGNLGSSHNLYIGLTSNGFNGWQWADNSGVDFFNWVPGEPNGMERGESCVEMYPWDGRWNDVDCLQGRGYVCKKSKAISACGDVPEVDRVDCGYVGIEDSLCLRRGCCWDSTFANANFSGCFYPGGVSVGPSGEPITTTTPENVPIGGGLSAGAIVGIILGVILLIAIGGVAFFCMRGDTKSIGMPSMPSMPSMPKFGNGGSTSSPSSAAQPSVGFDNPVVSMNAGLGMGEEDA